MNKFNVIVTAGGTSEPIDNVRRIANTGTGRLGSLVADAFAREEDAGGIFYVCARDAIRPASDKVTVVQIQSVADLQKAVTELKEQNRIDAVVHSMAVSDYTVRAVATAEKLAEALRAEGGSPLDQEAVERAMDRIDVRSAEGKLSSRMDSPILLLQQTPKILPTFRRDLPEAVIVGFKLLSRVSREKLLEVARALLTKNGCDYVLANDAEEIRGDEHHALLIDRQGEVIREMYTKQEIAGVIVRTVSEELKKR